MEMDEMKIETDGTFNYKELNEDTNNKECKLDSQNTSFKEKLKKNLHRNLIIFLSFVVLFIVIFILIGLLSTGEIKPVKTKSLKQTQEKQDILMENLLKEFQEQKAMILSLSTKLQQAQLHITFLTDKQLSFSNRLHLQKRNTSDLQEKLNFVERNLTKKLQQQISQIVADILEQKHVTETLENKQLSFSYRLDLQERNISELQNKTLLLFNSLSQHGNNTLNLNITTKTLLDRIEQQEKLSSLLTAKFSNINGKITRQENVTATIEKQLCNITDKVLQQENFTATLKDLHKGNSEKISRQENITNSLKNQNKGNSEKITRQENITNILTNQNKESSERITLQENITNILRNQNKESSERITLQENITNILTNQNKESSERITRQENITNILRHQNKESSERITRQENITNILTNQNKESSEKITRQENITNILTNQNKKNSEKITLQENIASILTNQTETINDKLVEQITLTRNLLKQTTFINKTLTKTIHVTNVLDEKMQSTNKSLDDLTATSVNLASEIHYQTRDIMSVNRTLNGLFLRTDSNSIILNRQTIDIDSLKDIQKREINNTNCLSAEIKDQKLQIITLQTKQRNHTINMDIKISSVHSQINGVKAKQAALARDTQQLSTALKTEESKLSQLTTKVNTQVTRIGAIEKKFNPHYYISSSRKTWDEAKHVCRSRNGHLASISSILENLVIRNEVLKRGLNNIQIGLHDRNSEGSFEWTDGSPVRYTNWDKGEPNNYGNKEHCTSMLPSGRWYDNDCFTYQNFACSL